MYMHHVYVRMSGHAGQTRIDLHVHASRSVNAVSVSYCTIPDTRARLWIAVGGLALFG